MIYITFIGFNYRFCWFNKCKDHLSNGQLEVQGRSWKSKVEITQVLAAYFHLQVIMIWNEKAFVCLIAHILSFTLD